MTGSDLVTLIEIASYDVASIIHPTLAGGTDGLWPQPPERPRVLCHFPLAGLRGHCGANASAGAGQGGYSKQRLERITEHHVPSGSMLMQTRGLGQWWPTDPKPSYKHLPSLSQAARL